MIKTKCFNIGFRHFRTLENHNLDDEDDDEGRKTPEKDVNLDYVMAKKPILTKTFEDLDFTTTKVFEEVDSGSEDEDCDSAKYSERDSEDSEEESEDFVQCKEENNCSKKDSNIALSLFADEDLDGDFSFFMHMSPAFIRKYTETLKNPVIYTEIKVLSLWHDVKYRNQRFVVKKSNFAESPIWERDLLAKYTSERVEIKNSPKLIPIEELENDFQMTKYSFKIRKPKFGRVAWKIQIYYENENSELEGSFGKMQKSAALILQKMYGMDETKDVTFLVAHGAEIKAHGSVLMAQSEPFQAMFSKKMLKTVMVELPENTEDGVELFVKFMYGLDINSSEVQITSGLALELLKLSHKYGVTDLRDIMKVFLAQKSVDYYLVDVLLDLFCFTRNVEQFEGLSKYSASLLSSLSEGDIQSSEYYKEKMNKDEVLSLLFTLNQN